MAGDGHPHTGAATRTSNEKSRTPHGVTMALRQVRLVQALIITVLLPTGCDGGSEPAATTTSPARETTAATRTYTKQELERGLLPEAQLPGFAEVSGEPEHSENIDVTALMPLKGIPRKCRASGGLGLVDLSGLGPAARTAPRAGVDYGRESTFFSEALAWLPADTPPGSPRLRVPPGCERQDGDIQNVGSYAVVKKLGKGQLPSINGAEVTGLQVDFHEKVADLRMMSFRLIQVRSGSLLMQTVTGTDGDIASVTNGPVTKAWAHAEQRFT
jgi:hypothetical protein